MIEREVWLADELWRNCRRTVGSCWKRSKSQRESERESERECGQSESKTLKQNRGERDGCQYNELVELPKRCKPVKLDNHQTALSKACLERLPFSRPLNAAALMIYTERTNVCLIEFKE